MDLLMEVGKRTEIISNSTLSTLNATLTYKTTKLFIRFKIYTLARYDGANQMI